MASKLLTELGYEKGEPDYDKLLGNKEQKLLAARQRAERGTQGIQKGIQEMQGSDIASLFGQRAAGVQGEQFRDRMLNQLEQKYNDDRANALRNYMDQRFSENVRGIGRQADEEDYFTRQQAGKEIQQISDEADKEIKDMQEKAQIYQMLGSAAGTLLPMGAQAAGMFGGGGPQMPKTAAGYGAMAAGGAANLARQPQIPLYNNIAPTPGTISHAASQYNPWTRRR